MKLVFRLFLTLHVFLYRLTGGRLGSGSGEFMILLLTTVGRKSGRARTWPLGAFQDGANYVVIASNGGQATHPAWFHNLQRNPNVAIRVRDKHITAHAEVVGPERRTVLWKRLLQLAPSYERYTHSTTREIPLVLLKPIA